MTVEENKQLMVTLDDAWNSQDWDTFNKRHAKEVAVYWPGQPNPTRGQQAHQEEAEQFFKTFPDNRVGNHPYVVLLGEGNWTCSVANFTGTMTGPVAGPEWTPIPPKNKKFQVEFCTVAHWNNKGQITEEKLFYDLVGLMKQIGLM
jgi:hypothetical protein